MDQPDITATIVVGWSSHRPIRPDEHSSTVVVTGSTQIDCELAAAQIVATRRQCEMVTRISTIDIVI